MKRAVIIVKGKVQRVGYRDIVEDIARNTNITGYVENLKPYDVRIVCEGEKENLERFIELIEIQKYGIMVKEVEVTFQKSTGEFDYFEIRRGDWQEEQGERMNAAVKYLFKSMEFTERSVQLGELSVEIGQKMLDKQDQMLDKQDQTIGSIEGLRADMGNRFDQLDEKYGEINKSILKAIDRIDYLIMEGAKDRELFRSTMEGLLKELIAARKGQIDG